jgi:murein DD-endopeptidase MepM/ murein hydrolase activator NlpD
MVRWVSLSIILFCAVNWIASPPSTFFPPQPTQTLADIWGADLAPPQEEISAAQEQSMWEDIQRNLQALRSTGALPPPNEAQAVTYAFPLRLAPGLPDDAGFRVSAFADHNPASGPVLDYNGGARTYDGHHATDYALWPFSWNKLDAGEMQVVAAAAGTILSSANVDPSDHNCNVSSSDPWNYVAVLHADGRLTIYGHLRYNSVTSKGAGQTVAQGEVLGTVGSSGNSSGPHLHFEVRPAGVARTAYRA